MKLLNNMMNYTLEECLPTVFIEKNGQSYTLHWASQNDFDASLVLEDNRDYIEGFLDGCYKVFSINYSLPSRVWGHNAGCVAGIPKEVAEELEILIKELLQGLVKARYANLAKKNGLS